jgi:hypothetical protein
MSSGLSLTEQTLPPSALANRMASPSISGQTLLHAS